MKKPSPSTGPKKKERWDRTSPSQTAEFSKEVKSVGKQAGNGSARGASTLLVGEFLGDILPRLQLGAPRYDLLPPSWPPDMFALCMSLLLKAGAYCAVLKDWPPASGARKQSIESWAGSMTKIGSAWRALSLELAVPKDVSSRWTLVVRGFGIPVSSLVDNLGLCQTLLELCAIADEACVGMGLPQGRPENGEISAEDRTDARFNARVRKSLRMSSTACEEIGSDRLRTLPKMRTPQSGLTIRSLSHNIALWTGGQEVVPRWIPLGSYVEETSSINLLLVPWPKLVVPAQFVETEGIGSEMRNMPNSEFGFFTFRQEQSSAELLKTVMGLYHAALEMVGKIDGVVLPESALTEKQHARLRPKLMEQGAFMIAGVGQASAAGRAHGENLIRIDVPPHMSTTQRKHHRWRLNDSQINQYGLGGRLNPEKIWWEHIDISKRELVFVAMQGWLAMAVLLCEDLARPDPVGDLVRAVGPNLVITLLMDGPQLKARWGSRYATTLADDPGCSVLTLTSLGMAALSRPDGVLKPSRVVALWKDAKTDSPREIELPEDCDGVVISLTVKFLTEWTADGRGDRGAAGYPLLSGIHPIRLASKK